MKKHNFYAGPAVLPKDVIKDTAKAVKEFGDMGLSLIEISHRTPQFEAVVKEACDLFKELLSIPDGYSVIFLGGGASMQFCMIPFNFLAKKAAYTDTGEWASKAIKEAKLFGQVDVVGSSKDKIYNYLPKGYTIPTDADYFHFTSNNTIYGTEVKQDIDCPVPLIADMSSDIFSRPVDVSKYAMIYGGAQKNLSMAGVTFVIIKNDMLNNVVKDRVIPTMLNYKTHVEGGSMFNTPPVLPIYTSMLTLRWIKEKGGVAEMQRRNQEKADMLYAEIERNKLFRPTVANPDERSIMNICWVMKDEYKELEKEFLTFAEQQNGMLGIKGHRTVGGFRASCYNALPKKSVQALIDVMQQFERMK